MEETFVIHGDLLWSDEDRELLMLEDGYLLVEEGRCAGVFPTLPESLSELPLEDYSHCLVLPGMTDLHTHASQYGIRGLGLDEELLVWLKKYTFPEEARFSDLSYAKRMYTAFTEDLLHGWTTRAVIKSGLVTYVGRVNMNRDGGENLCESDAATALSDTEGWLSECKGRYRNTTPIITPRFIPSCTDDLMRGLSDLCEKYGLRLQSHLSENPGEIELVKKLVPKAASYGAAYEDFGSLLNPETPAVMAHCVYSDEAEEALIMKGGGGPYHEARDLYCPLPRFQYEYRFRHRPGGPLPPGRGPYRPRDGHRGRLHPGPARHHEGSHAVFLPLLASL